MNFHDVFTQEIEELVRVRDRVGPEFDRAVSLIADKTGKVVVTGIGKSGIIAHKIAATLASTGTPVCFSMPARPCMGIWGWWRRRMWS